MYRWGGINMFLAVTAGVPYTCGNFTNIQIDGMLINLVHTIYIAIQIGVPVLLIFFGMLDLGKAVMAQKEDEIKKGQQMFIKRLVTAAIVFLVFFVVQLVMGLVAPEEGVMSCARCLINADGCKATSYTE